MNAVVRVTAVAAGEAMATTVTAEADSPEAAWRACAEQVLGPFRWRCWHDDDATLHQLLVALRRGPATEQTPITVLDDKVMPKRQPQGSDRWFTPVG